MAKKIYKKIILFVLAAAFVINCAIPAQVMAASSFKSYKVVITTTRLNIRSTASAKGKLVGYYYKNNIVDVTGSSGSWLKTSKGYISSAYTKKYTGTSSTPASSFQQYKAVIAADRLNIRSTASNSGKIVGYYYRNNIVDIIGSSGSWLKTSKGYIAAAYTYKYIASEPSRGGQAGADSGKYITMNSDEQLRLSPNGILDERYAARGKTYQIIYDSDGFYGIKFGSVIGYIPSSSASIISGVPKNKLTLAWNYIYAKTSNKLYYDDSEDYVNRSSASVGLDVISPTWFNMSGDAANPSSINVADIADKEYVKAAHKNGYEVWACFKEGNAERAYKVFYDQTVKERVISQVLNLAQQYGIDGINIDFEGIGGVAANKDGFTAFVRDLYSRAKTLNLTISADIIKPSTSQVWSKWYDRAALSGTVDYLMYMAYDEHSSSSKEAGSVGSYAWVEDGIKNILAEGVPSSKLVLCVPFYLRDFTVVEVNTQYDSVIPTKSSSLYSQPADSANGKLADAMPGMILKSSGLSQNKYTVEYNGQQGYIDAANVKTVSANAYITPANLSDGLRFSFTTAAAKVQTVMYSQSIENSSYKLMDIPQGSIMKYVSMTDSMYLVDYNGKQGYIPQTDTSLTAAGNNIVESSGLQSVILPYDTVIVTSQAAIYSNQTQTTSSSVKVADVTSNDILRYKGTSGKWYIVDYNGQTAYIPVADSIFAYANTKRTTVTGSSSIKMQTALDRISSYGGTTYYDSASRQQVGTYYKDGTKHIVWLENTESMSWRMDFVNSYDLPGTAAWQLYQETPDIWNIIKAKLKN